ncbi:MAG: abortive phage infection protein [Clostridiales bacterium]|jgi:predicted transcriptional regulator of viral defense system|nr:abortive phage infection protein [Clostridiales bacterium]
MSKADELKLLLQSNNGFLKTSDATQIGVSRAYLGEFVRKQGLERVAQGLYMSQDAWDDGMYVLQVRYPKAIFSHETALYLLNLAEREPLKYTLTLKTGANTAGLAKQGVKAYKVKDELFSEGITQASSPSGHTLRVYNAERTICDLFRSRRNIEIQDLQAAVREYIRMKEKNLPLLMRYAKAFSVERIVRQYMEVLL